MNNNELENLPRHPPVLVRLVIFLAIVNAATGIWACCQCVIPFFLEGSNSRYCFPGKLMLFTGSYLTVTCIVAIFKSSSLIRISIYSLSQSLNIVLLLESVAGASALALTSSASHGMLNASLLLDLETGYSIDARVTFALDDMQRKFRCCGVKGPADWLSSRWYQTNKGNETTYPGTCCDGGYSCKNDTVNDKGCGYEATVSLRHRLNWIYLCAFISIPIHLTFYLLLSLLELKA